MFLYLKTFFLCIVILVCSNSFVFAKSSSKILVFHSYHKGFKWTDSIMNGIESVLSEHYPDSDIFVEYMDTKRLSIKDSNVILRDLFVHKYRGIKFDCIICSDDNAFNFLVLYRDALFSNVPVIFCGINNLDESLIANKTNFTGVIENIDLKNTIEVALKLHPNTSHFVAIGDESTTGNSYMLDYRKVTSNFSYRADFLEISNVTEDEFKKSLRNLPTNTVVLLLGFYRDSNGKVYDDKETINLVLKNCKAPVYSVSDYMIGNGVVGGMVVNGWRQGQTAALMATRVLKGEPVASIPIIKDSPNSFMFDNIGLDKFGIDRGNLPEGSIIINEQVPFIWQYRNEIIALFSFFQLILLIILSVAIRQRKRAQKSVKENQERIRQIIDNVPQMISVKNRKGQFVIVNLSMAVAYGAPIEMLTGSLQADFHSDKKELDRILEDDRQVIDSKTLKVSPKEFFTGVDGNRRILETIRIPYKFIGMREIAVLCISNDITDKVDAEENLKKNELYYKAILEDQSELLCRFQSDGEMTFVNDAFCKYFGMTREELITKPFLPFVPEPEIQHLYLELSLLSPQNPVMMFEQEIVLPDGTLCWQQWSGRTIFNEEGYIVEYMAVGKDITDQKIMEESLKESEQRYRELVESTCQSLDCSIGV